MQQNLDKLTPIADEILLLLKTKKLTRKALAKHLGVSENGLKLMFDKDSYKVETLKGIAEFLKVNVTDLTNPTKIGFSDTIQNKQSKQKRMSESAEPEPSEALLIAIEAQKITIATQAAFIRSLQNKGEIEALEVVIKSKDEVIATLREKSVKSPKLTVRDKD